MSMLRSDPVAKDRRVVAHNKSRRTDPANRAATQKKIVNGSSICSGELNPIAFTKGCAAAASKTLSGIVKAPRKGNALPMLITSKNDEKIIKINKQ